MYGGGGAGGFIGDGLSPSGEGGQSRYGGFAENGKGDGTGGYPTMAGNNDISYESAVGEPQGEFGGGGGNRGQYAPNDEGEILGFQMSAGGGGGGYGAGGGGACYGYIYNDSESGIMLRGGRGADGVIFIRYLIDETEHEEG